MPAIKFTVRLPDHLKAKIDQAVRKRKKQERGYSLNKWLVEAAQAWLKQAG